MTLPGTLLEHIFNYIYYIVNLGNLLDTLHMSYSLTLLCSYYNFNLNSCIKDFIVAKKAVKY